MHINGVFHEKTPCHTERQSAALIPRTSTKQFSCQNFGGLQETRDNSAKSQMRHAGGANEQANSARSAGSDKVESRPSQLYYGVFCKMQTKLQSTFACITKMQTPRPQCRSVVASGFT